PRPPLGLDFERNPTVRPPMRIGPGAPPEIRAEIADEKTGHALLVPLPNMFELVTEDVLVIRCPFPDENERSDRCRGRAGGRNSDQQPVALATFEPHPRLVLRTVET